MQSSDDLLAAWCAAEARGDAAALEPLLDAEFRGDGPNGHVLGKPEWLARVRAGDAWIGACAWQREGIVAAGQTQLTRLRAGARLCSVLSVRRDGRWAVVNVQCNSPTPDPEEFPMSQVIADMSMSLDGYVAGPDDGIDEMFGWMFGGESEVGPFRTAETSADVLRDAFANVGALVSGRRSFDLARGWNGEHPMGVPVFVVTHEPPRDWPHEGGAIRFVTDGVESALAQAKKAAGGKIVGVSTPSITAQLLDAGLLDAVHVNLVPVVLGGGVRFFSNLAKSPVRLETPEVVESNGVTHLTYRVRKESQK